MDAPKRILTAAINCVFDGYTIAAPDTANFNDNFKNDELILNELAAVAHVDTQRRINYHGLVEACWDVMIRESGGVIVPDARMPQGDINSCKFCFVGRMVILSDSPVCTVVKNTTTKRHIARCLLVRLHYFVCLWSCRQHCVFAKGFVNACPATFDALCE